MRFLGYSCFLKGYKPENAIIIQPKTMRNKAFTQDQKDSNKFMLSRVLGGAKFGKSTLFCITFNKLNGFHVSVFV